ncbi:ribosome small subunit-dependent GTPase [endosymbiont 'TC1' of Trimyema compressum]|uniref:ribosome small subunit-dependent GTPase A n=1 Tax=endosymbiont 'TC1' of Trimyema compressum TaxID=243899 RepID=UPI0007F09E80|nr:ribosome small subunit-dependent GTPase A [endosymbiont 'TC1' of Trimyema compressum]AMP20967.1 ribosome small subunit-dependent GTPase [endosymbiont 'TC1' of Trimyema compressum]
MNYLKLKEYGLTDCLKQESTLYNNMYLARVTEQHCSLYKVMSEKNEIIAQVSGKLIHNAQNSESFPAVGDWVMIDRNHNQGGNGIINHILSRKSILARKEPGSTNRKQVIATNIDLVFLCMSLNANFNLRRMERYLSLVWDSGAMPVIILTKSDLCKDLENKIAEVKSVAIGVDIVAFSALDNDGYCYLKDYFKNEKTGAFIGSSGVGKSTLINTLLGKSLLATKNIRESDDKGRHTTTHRQLLLLPNGGIVIDTPGMRELQLYNSNLPKAFEDIESLSGQCKFNDCTHTNEPQCKVKEAIANGTLSKERLANYQKLQRETLYAHLNSRQLEQEKINNMFGSKKEIKQFKKHLKIKSKNNHNHT